MPETMTDFFLDGQGIPVALADIETELSKLWGPAAEQAGGPELENPLVTRIVLANLVVECLDRESEWLAPVLETVLARYPCRTIVMRRSFDTKRRITADVAALCHLPGPGLPQVCSERIVLRAGPNAADLVPGAVRPLLEADLPVVLWWTDDPRQREALFRDLADESSRLILDLPDPSDLAAVKLGLDPEVCRASRDSAWFGLTRWRELVAQFFDAQFETLKRIDSVKIEAFSPVPNQAPRLAVWLAAWLAAQLQWQPQGQPVQTASISETVLRANCQGPSGSVAIEIVTRPLPPGIAVLPHLFAVTITARGPDGVETFSLSRPEPGSPGVIVEVDAPGPYRLPRYVDAPHFDRACRVAAAVESPRIDVPFQNARPIAFWLLQPSA